METNAVKKKLRVPANGNMLISNAPAEFRELLNGFTYDTEPSPEKNGTYDFVSVFGTSRAELELLTKKVAAAGKYDCVFWACYPKGTGKIKSDVKRDLVWDITEQIGLRCVTQIAIDETWSALRARPHAAVGK